MPSSKRIHLYEMNKFFLIIQMFRILNKIKKLINILLLTTTTDSCFIIIALVIDRIYFSLQTECWFEFSLRLAAWINDKKSVIEFLSITGRWRY